MKKTVASAPSKHHRSRRSFLRIKSFRNELILIIFLLMAVTSAFTVAVSAILNFIFPRLTSYDPVLTIAASLIASTGIATLLSAILTKWILRPLKEMIDATQRIAKGDFKVHINESFDESSDFGILQRSFNHMTAELDGIEMFRSDFINNFSHEFKTPIVSIQGFARQLQAGGLSEEEVREYVNIIVVESDRLAAMSANILLLSKLENQQIVTDVAEFYLDEQIRTCLLLLEKQWSAKDIELNVDLDEALYCFNEDMLSHVWINLFSNAFKFTPPRGTVSCTLRKSADAITVTISDTGRGMTDEEKRHIFEKFYQGETSHNGEGNGVGLTIVSRIMVLCKGHVTVDSAPDMGTVFTVTLPLTAASPESH